MKKYLPQFLVRLFHRCHTWEIGPIIMTFRRLNRDLRVAREQWDHNLCEEHTLRKVHCVECGRRSRKAFTAVVPRETDCLNQDLPQAVYFTTK